MTVPARAESRREQVLALLAEYPIPGASVALIEDSRIDEILVILAMPMVQSR
jgi:hypothetical protein